MKIISKFQIKVVYGCYSNLIKHIPTHIKSYFSPISLARNVSQSYANSVQCKITELALVGYLSLAHTVRLLDFFCMRILSMHSHVMVKLEGDTFECAGNLVSQSTNPFQLCHPHLVVIGKASINTLGAH